MIIAKLERIFRFNDRIKCSGMHLFESRGVVDSIIYFRLCILFCSFRSILSILISFFHRFYDLIIFVSRSYSILCTLPYTGKATISRYALVMHEILLYFWFSIRIRYSVLGILVPLAPVNNIIALPWVFFSLI